MVHINDIKMAELLCSKLCHDLISPIGAINNGLEFLQEESADMLADATMLIGSSAHQAASKLAFFRLALGAGGASDSVEFDTVVELTENLAGEKKLSIDWLGTDSFDHASINKNSAKLLLNLALVAFDCLPRGGKIEFKLVANSENPEIPDLVITISGDKCNLRDDVKLGLNSQISEDSLTVRNVLPFYCVNLAKNNTKTLKLQDESPSLIVFDVS